MALKLLNPGLRPLGMFDLDDTDQGNLVGGEYVELAANADTAAADVGQLVNAVQFQRGIRTAVVLTAASEARSLGGLADEGQDEYGTLFGSLIGQTAGQATQVPGGGAVVIGPSTDQGSGKVTVWATAGLYGVTDQDASLDDPATVANAPLFGTAATGLLNTADAGSQVAIYVEEMTDSSLVSTTNQAAGETAGSEYHAVFLIGQGA